MPTSPLSPSAAMDVKRPEKKDEARAGDRHPEPQTQAVITEAGRCTCCPYGYHIDLDFLNFCKSITNGSALSNLKRIQRTKRKLRKSMEFMLQQQQPPGQEGTSFSLPASTPPPDVVNSTEASRLMHMVSYEQSATNQVLKDIDSAVNATLVSIDSMRRAKPPSQRYLSSDSEESCVYSPASPLSASAFASQQSQLLESFPAQPPLPPPRRSSLRYAHHSEGEEAAPGRKDSLSSASSVSTVSGEQVLGAGPLWNGAHSARSSYSSSHSLYTSESSGFVPHQHAERQAQATTMTAESLAAAMAAHFPLKEPSGQEPPSTPMSPNTTISKASLAAIREAMAVSLQRMRDLEEQVKAIPILQVRISVLKEEKRLLALQLKAKSGNISTRSVGVGGEDAMDSSPSSFSKSFAFFSTATHAAAPPARSPGGKAAPPTLPKPRARSADVGVGERSVVEPYLLQPALPCGYTVADNQVEHEIRRKSDDQHSSLNVAINTHKADRAAPTPNHNHKAVPHLQHTPLPRPAVRSVGVGEGSVHTPQPLQILNTEVRTVIIGANNSPVGKRNVGVEVKVPSRSVGVLFSSEEAAPAKRAVGVNVTADSFPQRGDSSRGERDLSAAALQRALQRPVKTVGTHCNIRPLTVNTGVQHCNTTDSGADRGQQGKEAVVPQQCCVGTMAKADTQDGSVNTEKDWERVRVRSEEGSEQAAATAATATTTTPTPCRQDDASTCTEPPSASQLALQTEVAIFEEIGAVSSTGVNTAIVPLTHASSNTAPLSTADKGVCITSSSDLVLVDNKATSTGDSDSAPRPKALCDRGVNTSSREPVLCMSRVECVEIAGEDVQPSKSSPTRSLTMQEHILQRGADQAFAFLGSTSSAGSLSPTSPKRLPAGAHQDPDNKADSAASAAAAAGADDCFTSGDADAGFTQQNVAAHLQSSSKAGLFSEERKSEAKTEQAESVVLAETSMRRLDGLTDSVSRQSSGRLFRHRNSDGARIAQELDTRPGIFSGRRVGSVEDFMPEEMRRLMNLDTAESDSSKPPTLAADLSSSLSGKTFSKTVRTVTTKQTQQESGSHTSTLADTAEEQEDSDEDIGAERKSLTKLSAGQLDLSQIAEDMGTGQEVDSADLSSPSECSESEGIKDSGYDDSAMVHNGAESSSLQGLDFSSMGSLERKELKSIMKTSKSDSPNPKKGISFAESVVGGTGSSSEDERTESDDESTTSYEEGSYDGREGDITYRCEDDEAIAQGLPGAKMYDQNIRETYELSEEMSQACQVLANYLVDSTTIQTKELNTNQGVVQEEWFRVSSHKLSSMHQVEDYLSSINEISHRLLQYVVNLVDSNGNAAIHYCVSHCNFDIVGLLLDTEVCDVKKPNKAGYTPAMLASLAFIQNDDHRDIIRQLFVAGHINAQAEKTGQTALMLATSQCRGDMVELLLETGADCNLQDFDGSTALMCACEHGHAAIVQLLLAQPSCNATLTDNEGSTALSIAMEAGHKDIGVILYKYLNFTAPGLQKKRKGSSSPTPSI